jgi:iron(III) transport system ATP-binding protein
MSAITLNGVSKGFGARVVVNDLSISVHDGERVALLGPSGCGKTTVLRLVSGLETPDSGSIMIGDVCVAEGGRNLVPPEQRHIGMVFQDLALWPHMTVSQHLEFALRYDPRSKAIDKVARIRELLAIVRMTDFADRKPPELSGGEQQRVALARALVANPSIVLMDEPMSSVDVDLGLHLRLELLRLHGQLGFTLLYVTHSQAEAEQVASRIIRMSTLEGNRRNVSD